MDVTCGVTITVMKMIITLYWAWNNLCCCTCTYLFIGITLCINCSSYLVSDYVRGCISIMNWKGWGWSLCFKEPLRHFLKGVKKTENPQSGQLMPQLKFELSTSQIQVRCTTDCWDPSKRFRNTVHTFALNNWGKCRITGPEGQFYPKYLCIQG